MNFDLNDSLMSDSSSEGRSTQLFNFVRPDQSTQRHGYHPPPFSKPSAALGAPVKTYQPPQSVTKDELPHLATPIKGTVTSNSTLDTPRKTVHFATPAVGATPRGSFRSSSLSLSSFQPATPRREMPASRSGCFTTPTAPHVAALPQTPKYQPKNSIFSTPLRRATTPRPALFPPPARRTCIEGHPRSTTMNGSYQRQEKPSPARSIATRQDVIPTRKANSPRQEITPRTVSTRQPNATPINRPEAMTPVKRMLPPAAASVSGNRPNPAIAQKSVMATPSKSTAVGCSFQLPSPPDVMTLNFLSSDHTNQSEDKPTLSPLISYKDKSKPTPNLPKFPDNAQTAVVEPNTHPDAESESGTTLEWKPKAAKPTFSTRIESLFDGIF